MPQSVQVGLKPSTDPGRIYRADAVARIAAGPLPRSAAAAYWSAFDDLMAIYRLQAPGSVTVRLRQLHVGAGLFGQKPHGR